ncbi:MAG: helix-turn-helix transcriptional regulator [Gammaproteobacteria bacterium]|nr:helix-turn-helix transcriptional regulator [Gammaproteobacteria bacterium]
MKYKVKSPKPSQVKQVREMRHLSMAEAAEIIQVDIQTWRNYEKGRRVMCPQFWELFNMKTNKAKFKS